MRDAHYVGLGAWPHGTFLNYKMVQSEGHFNIATCKNVCSKK